MAEIEGKEEAGKVATLERRWRNFWRAGEHGFVQTSRHGNVIAHWEAGEEFWGDESLPTKADAEHQAQVCMEMLAVDYPEISPVLIYLGALPTPESTP